MISRPTQTAWCMIASAWLSCFVLLGYHDWLCLVIMIGSVWLSWLALSGHHDWLLPGLYHDWLCLVIKIGSAWLSWLALSGHHDWLLPGLYRDWLCLVIMICSVWLSWLALSGYHDRLCLVIMIGSAGFDTNFYEQWSTGPPAERIWWSDNFFSGPDNNSRYNTWKSCSRLRCVSTSLVL